MCLTPGDFGHILPRQGERIKDAGQDVHAPAAELTFDMAIPHLLPISERRSAARRAPAVSPMSGRASVQPWSSRLPDDQWQVYQRVIQEARRAGVGFAFGGAFATAVYTGELRNTKDFDFYILPDDRDAMTQAISDAGLTDYFERLPYDRSWIYRASEGDVLVDAIWAMANQRAVVDPLWLSRGPLVDIRGEQLRAIPIEELIWSKLYVLQRERTDWGDVLNLIAAQADFIDWDHLLGRLATDAPLLTAALAVFAWLDPHRARSIPESVWHRLGLVPTQPDDSPGATSRASLIDTRPWFRASTR